MYFKGQIILKSLFDVFNFFQKTNENRSHSSKNQFIRSVFGRIHAWIICFWSYLTFSTVKNHRKIHNSRFLRISEWLHAISAYFFILSLLRTNKVTGRTVVQISGLISRLSKIGPQSKLSALTFQNLLLQILIFLKANIWIFNLKYIMGPFWTFNFQLSYCNQGN